MKSILILSVCILGLSVNAQTNDFRFNPENDSQKDVVSYFNVDEKPLFNGAKTASENHTYLNAYLKTKSSIAQGNGDIAVPVYFIIDKNGKANVIEVIYDEDDGLKNAAKKIIEEMPAWTPGKHQGNTVKVSYSLNIIF